MKSYEKEFEGICSGDYESFVWAVDKETFDRITPDYKLDDELNDGYKSPFEKDMYMIYPDDIFRDENGNGIKKKMKFKITYNILD